MIVQSKAQLLTLIREHQEQLQACGVRRCGSFGSFIRDQQDSQSDVDVLVEFEPGKKV